MKRDGPRPAFSRHSMSVAMVHQSGIPSAVEAEPHAFSCQDDATCEPCARRASHARCQAVGTLSGPRRKYYHADLTRSAGRSRRFPPSRSTACGDRASTAVHAAALDHRRDGPHHRLLHNSALTVRRRAGAAHCAPHHAVCATSTVAGRARLERLEQAVDTIAVEMERVSEGQRFLTKVLTESAGTTVAARPLPSAGEGPVQPNQATEKEQA